MSDETLSSARHPLADASKSQALNRKTGKVFVDAEASDQPPKRILIVEDSTEDMELMDRKLNNLHAIIDSADNLEMAYRVSRQNPPDVIICDVGVPMQSGSSIATFAEVLTFVRFQSDKACVVIITGNNETDESDIKSFYSAGALDYISKDSMMHDLELLDRISRAYKAHWMVREGVAAAHLVVGLSKMESRQDKLFQMVKRIDVGVNNVRTEEKRLLYDQAYKAGISEGESGILKRRRVKLAAFAGSLLGLAAYFGDLFGAFIRAFKHAWKP